MANQNPSMSIVSSGSSGQRGTELADSNMNPVQPSLNQQNRSSSDGPVGILWDIENCPVPSDVRPEDVAGNIRMALQVHPIIKGAVMMFSAYGDFNAFPRRLREGCQRTGVKLIDVPNGRKDAADKAILVDMFLFALDNPPPSTIMLISGDVDFAPALHILGQRGYTVILVIPSGIGVSSALSNAGKFVWDWPSVACGEGFVPPPKALMRPRVGASDISGYFMGCRISDNPDGQNEEEAIVYRGISQSYYNLRDGAIMSKSLSEYTCNSSFAMPCFPATSRSHSLPSGLNEVVADPVHSGDQNDSIMWVQPGDINGLKAQLEKMLELCGGCMPLIHVPTGYQKLFGRPLYMSEYGATKLVNLFKKMGDTMTVDGKGQKRYVYLRNWKPSPSAPSAPALTPLRKDKKGKGTREENLDVIAGFGSSDEYSDEERVLAQENDERRNQGKTSYGTAAESEIDDRSIEQFKYELQEILVSYSCRIFLGCFEAIYQQRYKKPLDYQRFGVDQLEELFDKVRDVVVLHEEPVSKRKFLTAMVAR
ncbi:NYN domain-containing protein/OST-HTH domain-containing protein [Cephalotus follicularis]|uniref:NYN domain-containing protein/OST-HTH domain-containing protein n=1 Tax=Cephalotus follicularis TaxID=3775 RepID=A0A1Q3CEY6_CEPFO|nr:NYN domain-containing protein/OST-HTH domain-containing protein [Cephalotus follicularis]